MSERKPLLCETIKYIIIGHGKQVFHEYLVKHQEFNSKIKPTIRNEKKKKSTNQVNKQKSTEDISVIYYKFAITWSKTWSK